MTTISARRDSRSPRTPGEVDRSPVCRMDEQRLAGVNRMPGSSRDSSRRGVEHHDRRRGREALRAHQRHVERHHWGEPCATSSPSARCRVNPAPFRWTVSMPRCTSTPTPSGVSTTNACGWTFMRLPATGATTVTTPASSAGSTAVPEPTSSCANTGSGAPASPTTVPATGATTAMPVTGEVLDVVGERVGLGTDDDLHDAAGDDDAVRAGLLQRRLVDGRGVDDLGAQAGDAALDLGDVVGSAEPGDDVGCLGHGFLPGDGRVRCR